MRHLSIFFIMFCALCYCLPGCGDGGGSSSESSGGSGSSDNTSSSGGQQAGHHGGTPGGIPGGAGAIGGAVHGTTGGASGQAQAAGDFAITGVARESIAPDASHFPEAGGLPVVRYHNEQDQPAERDITFPGKFPSTNKADYKASVKVDGQEQMNRSLTITSVAGDRIVIHFPPASDLNNQPGLFGKMTIEVTCQSEIRSIRIYIP